LLDCGDAAQKPAELVNTFLEFLDARECRDRENRHHDQEKYTEQNCDGCG